MRICLLRHGPAVDIGEHGVTCDADRMLSAGGRAKTAVAVRGLARLGLRPEAIVSSPLCRAVETAALAAQALEPGGAPESCQDLLPGADVLRTVRWLRQRTESSLLLVGHLPHLVDLAACLLGGTAGPELVLGKAAAAGLRCEPFPAPGTASLEWLLPRRVLERFG